MNSSARQPTRAALLGALVVLVAGFAALGVWQVERRAWKHDLIAAVESRVNADPVAAPATASENDAYRKVQLRGRYRHDQEALVRAVSDLGSGYWVLTPLETDQGIVLVNRGFITQEQRIAARREPTGLVTVTGLLRLTEPDGGFLRANDPQSDKWYSRDVASIARSRHIANAAAYFIDADASLNARGAPIGGLTVVRFADNHAAYALTWFAMSLLSLLAAWKVTGRSRAPRNPPAS